MPISAIALQFPRQKYAHTHMWVKATHSRSRPDKQKKNDIKICIVNVNSIGTHNKNNKEKGQWHNFQIKTLQK